MLSLLILSMIISVITVILVILVNLTAKKTISDREKSSPFECGFDPKSSSRLPFSMHFFLIAIIFLIFDVEITLLLPMIVSMKFNNMMMYSTALLFFIAILLLGLFHEWKQGALTWTN